MTEGNSVTCFYCNTALQIPSSIEHFRPHSKTTSYSLDNLFTVCANCNTKMDIQPRESEFVSFLTDLIGKSPQYISVMKEAILGEKTRYRADVLATRLEGSNRTRLLIECKSSRFTSFNRIVNVIEQLKNYKKIYGECQLVLAIPATLSAADIEALKAEGIELWDLDFLASAFSDQLDSLDAGYFKTLLLSRALRGAKKTRERELRDALKACAPGKRDWSIYQSLIGDILEHLFCPILNKPLSEHADSTKTNRRDFILPNYAEMGFWHFIRNRYMADYFIVDAKNYTRKVKKAEVLQVANYLKPHGAGCFGAIFSRIGGDSAGCAHTLKEQWLIHQKMILVFDDEEVYSMLSAKEDGRKPEELIGKKIEQFRLSM